MKRTILRLAFLAALMAPLPVLAQDAKAFDCPFVDSSLVSYEECIGQGYEKVGQMEKNLQADNVRDAKASWWRVKGQVSRLNEALAKADNVAADIRAAGKDLQDAIDVAGAQLVLREKGPAAATQQAERQEVVPQMAEEKPFKPVEKRKVRPAQPMPTYY